MIDTIDMIVDGHAAKASNQEKNVYYLEDEMIRLEKELLEDSWRAYEYMTYEKRVG